MSTTKLQVIILGILSLAKHITIHAMYMYLHTTNHHVFFLINIFVCVCSVVSGLIFLKPMLFSFNDDNHS